MSDRPITDHWEAFRDDWAGARARYVEVMRRNDVAFCALSAVIADPFAPTESIGAGTDYDVGDFILSYSLYND